MQHYYLAGRLVEIDDPNTARPPQLRTPPHIVARTDAPRARALHYDGMIAH